MTEGDIQKTIRKVFTSEKKELYRELNDDKVEASVKQHAISNRRKQRRVKVSTGLLQ